MTDSKNRDDNQRYKEIYRESRSGTSDPLKQAVDGLFFGKDDIKDSARQAGRADGDKYDSPRSDRPLFDKAIEGFFDGGGEGRKGPGSGSEGSSSGSCGGGGGGGGSGRDTSSLIFARGFILAAVGYFWWLISLLNNGGPESFGEFLVALPGVAAILVAGFYFGIAFLTIFAVVGIGAVIISVIFG